MGTTRSSGSHCSATLATNSPFCRIRGRFICDILRLAECLLLVYRSIYQLRSKVKGDPILGKKGGVNTKKMYDRVIKKYESEFATTYRLPICTVQSSTQIVPEKKTPVQKGGKKRIVRKVSNK